MADYVSLRDQKRITVTLPDIATQKAIANVLSSIDDKIELNRRLNATLEAMAQALFQSWFVAFDPVKAKAAGRAPAGMDAATAALFPSELVESELGLIPKGWEVGSILTQAKLLSGGTPKTERPDYWNGNVQWASAKDVSQANQTFLIETERTITTKGLEESATQLIPALGTVVVARGATTGRMVLFGKEMAMNQTCYALVSSIGTPLALHCQQPLRRRASFRPGWRKRWRRNNRW
jgi:type I restriction enzyme S subunit